MTDLPNPETDPLDPRLEAVLLAKARGLADQQIADELGLDPVVVQARARVLRWVLDVPRGDRTVTRAYRLGYLRRDATTGRPAGPADDTRSTT